MFALVADVESYPDFLPWCSGAEIHDASDSVVEATLELRRGGITKSFRTRNTLDRDDRIGLELVSGPFRALSGTWTFRALGDTGSKVALDLSFEFENRVVDLVLGPFFEEICNTLVDAFTRRAHEVYAEPRSDGA